MTSLSLRTIKAALDCTGLVNGSWKAAGAVLYYYSTIYYSTAPAAFHEPFHAKPLTRYMICTAAFRETSYKSEASLTELYIVLYQLLSTNR